MGLTLVDYRCATISTRCGMLFKKGTSPPLFQPSRPRDRKLSKPSTLNESATTLRYSSEPCCTAKTRTQIKSSGNGSTFAPLAAIETAMVQMSQSRSEPSLLAPERRIWETGGVKVNPMGLRDWRMTGFASSTLPEAPVLHCRHRLPFRGISVIEIGSS